MTAWQRPCCTLAVRQRHAGSGRRTAEPPSRAIRLTRLATGALAALDLPVAERMYRAALELDGGLGEAWCGLALLYMQRGDARACVEARSAALRLPTTPAQRAFMADVVALAAPYADHPREYQPDA